MTNLALAEGLDLPKCVVASLDQEPKMSSQQIQFGELSCFRAPKYSLQRAMCYDATLCSLEGSVALHIFNPIVSWKVIFVSYKYLKNILNLYDEPIARY